MHMLKILGYILGACLLLTLLRWPSPPPLLPLIPLLPLLLPPPLYLRAAGMVSHGASLHSRMMWYKMFSCRRSLRATDKAGTWWMVGTE